MCYYESWTYYRTGNANFLVSMIPANMCTHLNYAFAALSGSNIRVFDSWLDTAAPAGLGKILPICVIYFLKLLSHRKYQQVRCFESVESILENYVGRRRVECELCSFLCNGKYGCFSRYVRCKCNKLCQELQCRRSRFRVRYAVTLSWLNLRSSLIPVSLNYLAGSIQ